MASFDPKGLLSTIVRFALRLQHAFYVLAALVLFLGGAAVLSMRSSPGRAFRGRLLRLEGDAELCVGAPHHTARAARAAVLEGQLERLRHTVGIRQLEAGAPAGDVLDPCSE